MKKVGKKNKTSRRKKGAPPRWLMLGALAASTALVRMTPAAYAEDNWREKFLTMGNTETERQSERLGLDSSAVRFDIPPGPLDAVLKAFSDVTGYDVEVTDDAIHSLSSPGVSGLFTPHQALEKLLAGTDVIFRFTLEDEITLSLRGIAESIDVTTRPAPSSPKYTEPLRETPQSLTVIPQRVIEEQGATSLRDILRNVTGISLQAGEGGGGLPGDNLTIRGFASRNDIFVDGVRDFGAYSRDPFNVEQVEVTKGPGSLYMGRGSTGGSLNLSTKRPQLDSIRDVSIGVGTDNYSRTTFDLNHPLSEVGLENAALRLNAVYNQGDVPGRDVVENKRWGIAPSLAFGLGTPTRVTLSYSYLDQDNIPEYGLPWVPPTNVPLAQYADKPAPVDFDNFYGLKDRDYEETETSLATLQVDHDLNSAVSLRSLVRSGTAKRDSVITAPRFASNTTTDLNRQLQSRDLEDEVLAWQTDITARFETGAISHAVVAGVEIAREDSENFARTGPTAPLADLFNPDPGAPYSGPITRTGARTESNADTGALFVSDTVELGEKWQLSGGLRYDDFAIDYESRAVDGVVTSFDRSDEMLSWRAGIVHNFLPNASVYVAAGTSFNPSSDGATGLSLSATTVDLEPEKSLGYEVGTKWDFSAARLGFTAALFRTDKTNARTPGINPGDPAIVLDGEQRIDGFEVGITGTPIDPLYVFVGYTYLQSEILESNTPAEVGKELANTPEHSLSVWTTYRLGQAFQIGGGANYVGDRFNNNTETRIAPSYWLFDAMASYDVTDWLTLRLNVNNLADERYIDRVGGGHFVPGAGRSAALTTQLKF